MATTSAQLEGGSADRVWRIQFHSLEVLTFKKYVIFGSLKIA
jgi:hypothetical protein